MYYSEFESWTFDQHSYSHFVLNRQCDSIANQLMQAGFSGVWACDFDGSIVKQETLYTASRKWSHVIDPMTGRQDWHETRRKNSSGEISTQLCLELELQAIFRQGRTLTDCLDYLSPIVNPVSGAPRFMRLLNKHGIALVIVSNGPHQIVSNLMGRRSLRSQTSPTGMVIRTPVVANLLVCGNSNCNQQLMCKNCQLSFLTSHGAIGVDKGDVVRRLAASLPVRFTTGDSVGGDSPMLEETVKGGGTALIRPSENTDGSYNNNLLEWAQRTLPWGTYTGFRRYQQVMDLALSKLRDAA